MGLNNIQIFVGQSSGRDEIGGMSMFYISSALFRALYSCLVSDKSSSKLEQGSEMYLDILLWSRLHLVTWKIFEQSR